jgi:hypothetical protein
MAKKLLLLFGSCLFSTALLAQTPIPNFEQLMTSLKAGKSVRVVIYYGKCKLFSDGKEQAESPNAIGGMKFDTYEYFDSSVFKGTVPSFVTSSQNVLINHPRHGYVYNYVKIKVYQDSSVEITARYLKQNKSAADFQVVMDETFKGKMNDGSNDGAVSFFTE